MTPRLLARTFLGVLACLGASVSLLSAADDRAVVVVLSSKSGPYQQALQGFQRTFGQAARTYALSEGDPKISPETKVIVAIGGKAAVHAYQAGRTLIYCLAPGTKVASDQYDGRLLKIHTSPSVALTIGWFKEIQPSLKRLAILWNGDSIRDYFGQKTNISDRFGVELVSDRIQSNDSLPDHLRALKGNADAIWLPPDPAIVTAENFATIREFSIANGIPFYAPSEGLVDQGAVAAVSASFEDIGALAGEYARDALSGTLPEGDSVFPEKAHATLNVSAAKACGLRLSPELEKKADRVIS